ncbi:FAD-binding oxidoreductase [Salinibacillus xinjiangensis]|uniref:D-lactate dehydrogenase (cytochrome) n=1 Tax=Salinibacillus xinjiangensis TaxID=1229268 RepID=A0A6G1X224_9BACI|nr:FAD-linked oxidase C-terminal domain-containing protein [Salinibacillus xinjiangensis]MRG84989.1 FAD-binding protein [Salinibacillus xinjiangensis]
MYIPELKNKLGSNKVSQSESALYKCSHDESPHQAVEPDVVCFPENREDVEAILEVARTHHVPVTAFGTGSGLEGQAIPIQKGISINFEQMNKVIDFSPEDMTVTLQPGMTRLELNKIINREGLMFPIDPGADASIGGMVATNASGTTAVRYGSMRDQLLDLEVVLADGSVIHTGTRAKKSSSGYHLTGLFAGSEGTLGIITEITLRLHGIPEYTMMARCTFETLEQCTVAAQNILHSGVPVMRMELIDAPSIAEVNRQNGYDFPEKHSLFIECAGAKNTVIGEVDLIAELMNDLGCSNWDTAKNPTEQKEIWKARHELTYAFSHVKGSDVTGADVCVPISRLPELVDYARELVDESGLKGGIWGHVGDGNFHTLVVFDRDSEEERKRAEYTNEALAVRAIEVGGTCTGEHGVGLGKIKFQQAEHGTALNIMKQTKQLYDPQGLLNPGKIFSGS